jgi:hypothetical protein
MWVALELGRKGSGCRFTELKEEVGKTTQFVEGKIRQI